jgi:regulator of RNase E activity RraA
VSDAITQHGSSPSSTPAVQPGAAVSREAWKRATTEQLDRYRRLPSANIGDAMHRLGVMDAAIKPVWNGPTIVGSAYTVWTRPGDNLALHEALKDVQPGDVIVVNGGGDLSRALLGELIGGKAKVKGVVGFVIDGAVRDASGLAEYAMPVYARAVTPAGPYKDGPFTLAAPVAVGGVVVNPGDIIVADEDGVVVVPLEMADAVAHLSESKHESELETRRRIDADLQLKVG